MFHGTLKSELDQSGIALECHPEGPFQLAVEVQLILSFPSYQRSKRKAAKKKEGNNISSNKKNIRTTGHLYLPIRRENTIGRKHEALKMITV